MCILTSQSAKVHQAAAEAIAKSFQDLSVSISAFPEKVWALPDEVDESNTVKKDFIIRECLTHFSYCSTS